MKKLIVLFCFISSLLSAQYIDTNFIGIRPIMPEFPGGEIALVEYFQKNLKYKEVIESQIEGTIMIEFIVKKNGKISNIKIDKGLDKYYDKQVIEIAKKMPRWKPARDLNGKKVNCHFNVPIRISLED